MVNVSDMKESEMEVEAVTAPLPFAVKSPPVTLENVSEPVAVSEPPR